MRYKIIHKSGSFFWQLRTLLHKRDSNYDKCIIWFINGRLLSYVIYYLQVTTIKSSPLIQEYSETLELMGDYIYYKLSWIP